MNHQKSSQEGSQRLWTGSGPKPLIKAGTERDRNRTQVARTQLDSMQHWWSGREWTTEERLKCSWEWWGAGGDNWGVATGEQVGAGTRVKEVRWTGGEMEEPREETVWQCVGEMGEGKIHRTHRGILWETASLPARCGCLDGYFVLLSIDNENVHYMDTSFPQVWWCENENDILYFHERLSKVEKKLLFPLLYLFIYDILVHSTFMKYICISDEGQAW